MKHFLLLSLLLVLASCQHTEPTPLQPYDFSHKVINGKHHYLFKNLDFPHFLGNSIDDHCEFLVNCSDIIKSKKQVKVDVENKTIEFILDQPIIDMERFCDQQIHSLGLLPCWEEFQTRRLKSGHFDDEYLTEVNHFWLPKQIFIDDKILPVKSNLTKTDKIEIRYAVGKTGYLKLNTYDRTGSEVYRHRIRLYDENDRYIWEIWYYNLEVLPKVIDLNSDGVDELILFEINHNVGTTAGKLFANLKQWHKSKNIMINIEDDKKLLTKEQSSALIVDVEDIFKNENVQFIANSKLFQGMLSEEMKERFVNELLIQVDPDEFLMNKAYVCCDMNIFSQSAESYYVPTDFNSVRKFVLSSVNLMVKNHDLKEVSQQEKDKFKKLKLAEKKEQVSKLFLTIEEKGKVDKAMAGELVSLYEEYLTDFHNDSKFIDETPKYFRYALSKYISGYSQDSSSRNIFEITVDKKTGAINSKSLLKDVDNLEQLKKNILEQLNNKSEKVQ